MTKSLNNQITRFQVSVAPMMDWTDRHCRHFHRLISPSVTLYTEMVTTGALIHGDTDRFLRYHASEHPLVLQLGGSDPDDLATCAKMAEDYGYDEINLNCGCPSERVQKGAFGACLMREPELVAACMKAMSDATSRPVTVKCRIGIDDSHERAFLDDFIKTLRDQGNCTTFIVHARKAWLKGLSPKENREVPPLNYERVYQLKQDFPDLTIILNGGLTTIEQIDAQRPYLDGVMIGREAYHNPWFLRDIETRVFGNTATLPDEQAIITHMMDYARTQIPLHGTPLHSITRHMTGLFQGQRGARKWRQHLSAVSTDADNNPDFVLKALENL